MTNLEQVLRYPSPDVGRSRFPVLWSEQKQEQLARTAKGDLGVAPVDAALAAPLLQCATGDFVNAEAEIITLLSENLERLKDRETFISFTEALFVVQRLDLLTALLTDQYGFTRPISLSIEPGVGGVGIVRWDISHNAEHRFVFDANVFTDDNLRVEILTFQWEFPLFSHYANAFHQEAGSVFINRHDIGIKPGLAYCDNRPEFFLIPDYIFVPTKGYAYARESFQNKTVRWGDRKPVAFWRGSTTGIPDASGGWSSLPRAKLCQMAQRHDRVGLLDVGFSSVAQLDEEAAKQIRNSGLMREFVSWQEWNRYKYHIDIDGNSSPWSNLFQRLLTGSPVLKVESSRGLTQWYYDELRPWQNYVPIASDMSDLIDKVKWLGRNDRTAQEIGRRGLELAELLSYERELNRSIPVISAAFRYFNGRPGSVGPYGRASPATSLTFTQPYWTNANRFGGDF